MSAELRLMVAPHETYARLARARAPVGPLRALRRPALVALVLGTSIALAATRHAPPALVLSTTVCWLFVVLLQAAIALALIAAPARRTIGVARAFDLFFASHAPWSLWMLFVVLWAPSPLSRPLTPVLVAALAPAIMTPLIIVAFFREVLGLDPRQAIVRTAAHQALTWGACLLLYGWSVALLARLARFMPWVG